MQLRVEHQWRSFFGPNLDKLEEHGIPTLEERSYT